MAISKVLIGIIVGGGGISAVALTTAGSLGAFSSPAALHQSSLEGQGKNTSLGHSPVLSNSKWNHPNHIRREECYKVAFEPNENINLIFCTDSQFYLYWGASESITKIKSVKAQEPTKIVIELEGDKTFSSKVFNLNGKGLKDISRDEELNRAKTCNILQTSEEDQEKQILVCKNVFSSSIPLLNLEAIS